MTHQINNLSALSDFAKNLVNNYPEDRIFIFDGPMGVGKTTLIQFICKELGSTDNISSPTFSLVNEYESDRGPLFHFDFYRLEIEEEAFDMGYEDYFFSGHYCFIEWPSKIPNLLPEKALLIDMKLMKDEKREIKVSKTDKAFHSEQKS